MRKLCLAALLGLGLILAGAPAQAGGGYHGHGYGHGGHHYNHGHGDGAYYALYGAIAGGLLAAAVLSRPRYHAPPAYYAPPPPRYQSYCVQDQVYRTLPDGRIQTGTRTRCY